MTRAALDSSNIRAPLAVFKGARPPAPAWFQNAVSQAPTTHWITARGAKLEVLVWGESHSPGLLLMHGNGAHAGWWRFIAPFFADRYRVAAFSWSGMGGSDWRAAYDIENFVEEILAVGQHVGLFENAVKPVAVAHSFGAGPMIAMAARHGALFRAGIIIDAPIYTQAEREMRRAARGWKMRPPSETRVNRIYSSLEAALARFRLAPPQPCENLFIADLIAREGLKQARASNGEDGWTWAFDPLLWRNYKTPDLSQAARAALCPLALIVGARSALMQAPDIAMTRAKLSSQTPFIVTPDSDHHIMIDQPLALTACLETLLAAWAQTF